MFQLFDATLFFLCFRNGMYYGKDWRADQFLFAFNSIQFLSLIGCYS